MLFNLDSDHLCDYVSGVHIDGDQRSNDVPHKLGERAADKLSQLVQVLCIKQNKTCTPRSPDFNLGSGESSRPL